MLQVARDCAVSDGVRKAATISSLEQNVIELQCLVGDYQGRIREDEMTRRALHNRIQELKGSYCTHTHTHTHTHIQSNHTVFSLVSYMYVAV